jgi:hypothetical protein
MTRAFPLASWNPAWTIGDLIDAVLPSEPNNPVRNCQDLGAESSGSADCEQEPLGPTALVPHDPSKIESRRVCGNRRNLRRVSFADR